MIVATTALVKQGYYGLPAVKRPLWGWEISFYFFLEGISSGSYAIAAIADLAGGRRYRKLVRTARYVALATLAPCPLLLIADLGRPERFHHMLRIGKLTSPMNVGAWALTAYGQHAALLAFLEVTGLGGRGLRRVVSLAGMPFALTMIAYPGVLLSTTATPMWARSNLLGALLAASSMSAAAGALNLVRPTKALERVETVARGCETAILTGYMAQVRKPSPALLIGIAATSLAVPVLLKRSKGRRIGFVSSLLTLAGSLALKWFIVHAGRDSAREPNHG